MGDGLEDAAGSCVGWIEVGEGISLEVGEGIGVVAGKLHATRGKTARTQMSVHSRTRRC